jgi:hypothetical protein
MSLVCFCSANADGSAFLKAAPLPSAQSFLKKNSAGFFYNAAAITNFQ